ncbi:hypothetical protein LMIV_1930 [Listeria monocytogenes FSL J1-208]|nr:hypothetical protein LMIV_1930 [Listeria monocytogenes FSL J1-208]
MLAGQLTKQIMAAKGIIFFCGFFHENEIAISAYYANLYE